MDQNDNPIKNITDPILIELSKHVGKYSHIKKIDFSNDEILKGYIMEKNSDLSIIPNEFIKKIGYNFILQYHYKYINQIPKDMITQEMLNNIVKSKNFFFKAFDNINKDILNKEMVVEFIKTKKCININQIPNEFLTEEILLEAMKNNDLNLSYHQYLLTNNISHKMINSNYHYSLKFIKEEYQTKEICFQSLEIKGFKEATYILLKNLTKEDWRKILHMGYYNSGNNIPKEFLDEEFYKLIVKNSLKDKNTTMIYNIKKEYIDFEDYCNFIKLDVSNIFTLNPEMDDYKDLCKVAISINYEIYEKLPKNIIKNPDMIKYIKGNSINNNFIYQILINGICDKIAGKKYLYKNIDTNTNLVPITSCLFENQITYNFQIIKY